MTHKDLEQKIQEYLDNVTPESLEREYEEYCTMHGIFDKPWIPLSERLPPPGIDVVVKDAEGIVHHVYLCACCRTDWRMSDFGCAVMINPTHWKDIEDEA